MKSVSAVIFMLVFTSIVFSGAVTYNLTIPEPRIDLTDNGHRVVLDEALSTGAVGEPRLPVWGLNILLPMGEEAISVTIDRGQAVSLGTGFNIPPVQKQYPLSFNGPADPEFRNEELYRADSFFPQELAASFRTDFYRGYGIASIAVNPVTYNPVTGELLYYPNLTASVEAAVTAKGMAISSSMLKRDVKTWERVSAQIDNPLAITQYGMIDPGTDEPYYDVLLITHEAMLDYWSDYIDWKTNCGYYVAVETVQDIYAAYTGQDGQDQIRNCVIDYYLNYDLTWVFLAADDEFIPHRGLYASSGYTDNDIAADLYYAGLDGNWNTDGDSHWGEPGEDDLRQEVYVSRAAVDSQTEIANFLNKQLMFAREPVVDQIETSLMVGEDLSWPIWAWEYKEEVRTGSSSWGFTTEPFPADWEVRTLYEYPGQYWSGPNDLVPMLNQGPIYVNHLGHADVTYMMQLNNSNISDAILTNDGVNHNFYLVYSQGCYCGSFDNRTTGSSYVEDCISEKFSVLEHGAVAMVTNSRYGWGNLSTTQGSSQYFDKQFFDAIWGEGLTFIAETNADSKHDCIAYIDYNQNRWCYYQLNVFAEPTLDLWTDEPMTMAANYASEVMLGSASFQVSVPGLEDAKVCLSMNGTIHGTGFTDASGTCTLIFSEPLLNLGAADLVITAHNYLPFEGTVTVIPPTGAYVIYQSCEIDDQQGNANGVWDYAETTYFDMTVENVGIDPADNVIATISTEDDLVTILQNTANFGAIAQGASGTVDNAFEVSLDGSVENGHYIAFTLESTAGGDTWTSYFSLQVYAPDIKFSSLTVDDAAGNGNGNLDPGETATLEVTLLNDGGCYTTGLEAVLWTTDTYVTVNSSIFNYDNIAAGQEGLGTYEVSVSASCPQEHNVNLNLNFTDALGYEGDGEFDAVVGDITYDPTGPDNYGYSAYDPNDLPEMPVYDWVEISPDSGGLATLVNFTSDDQVLHFALPFNFTYYGDEYDSLTIATNGWIGMGIILEDDYSNSGIPNTDGPPAMIAPYWEDLSPQRPTSGGVWYWYDETEHRFIVEYNHVEQFAPVGDFETFEVILYDPAHYETVTGDGRIMFNFKNMSETAINDEGTVGIENPAETDGIEYLLDGEHNIHAMTLQNEMCILFSTPVDAPELTVILTPENPPIVIPASGGSFQFNVEIINTGTTAETFDVWSMVTLPNGSEFGPILNRPDVNLTAGGIINRDLNQNVPVGAPSGNYTYSLYTGNNISGLVIAEDEFAFSKSATLNGGMVDNWNITGWGGEATLEALPIDYTLKQNYPNPFNPVTTIEYTLPEAAKVKLTVFNTIGQEVAVLAEGFQTAGFKSVEFDAGMLSSGIYFYRIEAGDFKDMKKMVLIK